MPPTLSTPPTPYLLSSSLNLNLANHETLHFHTNTLPFARMHASDEYIGTVCSVLALACIMSFILYRTISRNEPQLRGSVWWPRYEHPKRAIRRVMRRLSPMATAQECEERGLGQSGGSGVQADVELVPWDSQDTTLQGSVSGNDDRGKPLAIFEDGRWYDENGYVWVDL